jgi:polysaccharide export outer membrane protein
MRWYFNLALILLVLVTGTSAAQSRDAENERRRSQVEKLLKEYRLGPGDAIGVNVFGENDLSVDTANVGDGGVISLPLLGDLSVIGLTTSEIEERIVAQLKQGYLVNPKVSVAVKRYRPVYLNGQVKNSGSFDFEPGLTIRKAVSKAGGFTERANKKKIFVISEGRTKAKRVTLDSLLRPGDIITVEESFF